MNLEIENGNLNKKPESAGFFVDFTKKDIGLIDKDDSIAEGEVIRSKAGQLDVEIEAKRPGPKSSAQTPAKPSERKQGSSKNKPGSAGEKGSDAISFSNKVIEALKNKVKEHNAKHSRKVTLAQLKKVYRRGAGAFSSSHRPGKTRGQWAMARVNMFLRMMSGGKVKDAYRKADQDVAKGSADFIDISDSWEPEEQDVAQALLDMESIGDFDFENADELYLDEYSSSEKWYEI
jgi:hypothetical protein